MRKLSVSVFQFHSEYSKTITVVCKVKAAVLHFSVCGSLLLFSLGNIGYLLACLAGIVGLMTSWYQV